MLRYVDLYMSDVSHLLSYDPSHRFYPHHAMHMVSYDDDDDDDDDAAAMVINSHRPLLMHHMSGSRSPNQQHHLRHTCTIVPLVSGIEELSC